MGSVKVGNAGVVTEAPDLHNFMVEGNSKVCQNDIAGNGRGGPPEGDELRLNMVAEDVNGGREGVMWTQSQAAVQKSQLPLGPVVRWERFLPFRSLKVLLVESDDSTRQVVGALLRNCSYEVTAATNGFQAWKILEDLTNQIDLVLTEVVLPCLSGISLLHKIMSHKTCKNIPVIMMSSHDSMGIVFKCLSKGAVDFLGKPIRKNELKNLWQHIWRRCHSSSGSGSVSGSESGIHNHKSLESRSLDESDDKTGSSDEGDDDASIELNHRDGSDNGSGTQSSCTKRAVEINKPQQTSIWDRLPRPQDGTCAEGIHPKAERLGIEHVSPNVTWDGKQLKELVDDNEMGKDLEMGVPRNSKLQFESHSRYKLATKLTRSKQYQVSVEGPDKDEEKKNEGAPKLDVINNLHSKHQAQASCWIGSTAHWRTNAQIKRGPAETPCRQFQMREIDNNPVSDTKALLSLDLSLKRLRSSGDGGTDHNEGNVLRHSAFSRYNTDSSTAGAPAECGGRCSFPHDNSSEAVKAEYMCNLSHSNAAPLNQGPSGCSNNDDIGSSTQNAFIKPATLKDKSASTLTAMCTMNSSTFQPLQHCHNCLTQQVVAEKTDDISQVETAGQPRTGNQVQVQHHRYHYHHRQHVQDAQQPPLHPDQDTMSLKNLSPNCGSFTVFGAPAECNGNCSFNGSASGSNHGSNESNGSNTGANNGGVNIENDDRTFGKSETGGSSGSGSGVNQNHFDQREAALTKFRRKRKERCFIKKVRYQSRKRLAEQRLRVHGKFLPQVEYEHTSRDTDC